ncbi:MAG: mannonate dehydratase [Candidatus Handelsmanbacteria bacterium]|nr:mannonate dehydratase [Candidatus Handelsmanbacteria bacterium]
MKLMDHLGWQELSPENLNFYKATGVDYLMIHLPGELADGTDRTDEFRQLKRMVENHGLQLYTLHCGGLPRNQIVYGRPGRDQQVENWIKVVRAIGRAGVPTTATTFFAINHFRTPSTRGRGNAEYSTFVYDELMKDPPKYPGREISEEQIWENIEWFLKRVIPAAEEAGVRIALHPDDPPIPEPLGGAARIVTSIPNYQRIFNLAPSPSNGMLFCQGCVSEMGEDVFRAIRYMAERDKIVFVHFRNIRGGSYNFQEVFIDEGQTDMLAAMQTYRDAGYRGAFMMDHTPGIPHPSGLWAGRAYANGYIKALIQMVYGRKA